MQIILNCCCRQDIHRNKDVGVPDEELPRCITYKGSKIGSLGYSFSITRHGHFRVQFYIDAGDKEKNKALYDRLYVHKHAMQAKLDNVLGSLEWERMDDKRASRIALYHPGSITDSTDELAKLREWAVKAMIWFQKVIEQYVSEVV